nr:MucR family transcriptional regulator [Sphingomonas sp. CDS-1]
MAEDNQTDVTALTVQLLSAFVSNNEVSSDSLADLIKTTRAALTEDLAPPAPATAPDYVPAVSVRKSLASREHILSLIDGKPYKTLKRHLATHGLTEKDYRARYNLPASYPMVAPGYSEARRAVAQKLGLGRKSANGLSDKLVGTAVEHWDGLAPKTPTSKASAKQGAAKSAPSKPDAAAAPTGAGAVKEPSVRLKAEGKAAAASNAKKAERKRRSIRAPKDDRPASTINTPSPTAAARTAALPKEAGTAKTNARPKSLKDALGAASAHLKGDSNAPG